MSSSFRLGSWVVHPELNAVTCPVEGESASVEEVRVEPRVMQVLVHFAQHPGEVIPREQFLEEIWNGVFVSDEALTNAIKELRKALRDDPKSPRFIQTVPKKGYRLIAPVSRDGVEPWTGAPLERNPYPGLTPFSESDAALFFGREDEVETLLEKLCQHHLLALIGPSGVGKSSLLRAGLLPSLPGNWQAVVCHPGERPFSSLAEALVPELPVDTESTKQLLRFEDIDVAASVLKQWRQKHQEVLVIVDQFEELFTLSPKEIQSRFAALLGRTSEELGIHVLLSMRDDFLIHCHDHPALAPVFRDLTPLKSPTGDALRRALVEPARLRGYRFEEEALVGEMLEEVSEERGALPLLSFAAARLWERRNRENHLLTRGAYNAIGGVCGALAQRAEELLEGLGTGRHETVREIFRNLITANGTRAARDLEELLSVFDDPKDAQTVLSTLIDARLLTSFELPSRERQPASHRIELIHESLLSHWPRLVRWQTQDVAPRRADSSHSVVWKWTAIPPQP